MMINCRIEYIGKIISLILIYMISVPGIFSCEMVAIKGLNGYNLSTSMNDGQDIDILFKYFRSLGFYNYGYSQERNGFGMVFYLHQNPNTRFGTIVSSSGVIESDRRFAHFLMNATQDSTNYYPNLVDLSVLGHTIRYGEMRTVFAHKRYATSAGASIPNPHPFVYRYNGRSYSFMHNGTIRSVHLTEMHAFINDNIEMLNEDTELDSIYHTGASPHSKLDSSVYFTYLLIHIRLQGFDILRGINTALNSLSFQQNGTYSSNNQHNFILTDGYDLYTYKNSYHPLRFYYAKERNIAIVSSRNHNYYNAEQYLSDFSQYEIFDLENRTLLYIPGYGDPIFFKGFTALDKEITMIRLCDKETWYWYGLPLIQDKFKVSIKDHICDTYINNNSLNTENYFVDRVETQNGVSYYDYNERSWTWDDSFNKEVNSNLGIKLKTNKKGNLSESFNFFSVKGKLVPIEAYTETFLPYNQVDNLDFQVNQYWVTYNLTSGQTLQSALGEHFDRIRRVYADNWTYFDTYHHIPESKNVFGVPVYNGLNANRPMEFGKTYIIELKENATPITNFKWNDSRESQMSFSKLNKKSEYFDYERKMKYEAIDIISLSENPEDCLEIAVFANETCIGATKVDGFPVQILIYSQGYEGIPLAFKALYPNGIVSKINPIIETFNTKSGEILNKVLIAGQVDYAIVNLDNSKDNNNYEIPAIIIQHSVYPNPFNFIVGIKFYLRSDSMIEIEIYNIKGQKVKTLDKGLKKVGENVISWNGTDDDNQLVGSGLYFYRLKTDHYSSVGKMIFLK